MKFITFSALTLAILGSVTAQGVDAEFSDQCVSVCQPIATLPDRCNSGDGDDDQQDGECLCGSSGAATQVPVCQACMLTYDQNNGSDNDVNDILTSCGLPSTTYAMTTALITTSNTAISVPASTTQSAPGLATAPTSAASSCVSYFLYTIVVITDDNDNDDDGDVITSVLTSTTILACSVEAAATSSSTSTSDGSLSSANSTAGSTSQPSAQQTAT